MSGNFARIALPIAAGIVAGAISGGVLGGTVTSGLLAGFSNVAAGAIAGGLLGAVSVGIGFLAEALAPRPPKATSRIDDIAINTYTRTGRVPLVYGYRPVGTNIVLLGKLTFKPVGVGISNVQESHLFAQMVLAVCEGPIRQIVGLESNAAYVAPETFTYTLGDGTEGEVQGYDAFLNANRVPSFRHTATINLEEAADLGYASDIPPFAAEVRGIYPEGRLSFTKTVAYTPVTAGLDGMTNRFFYTTATAGVALVVVTVPYDQAQSVTVQAVAQPEDVVGSVTMAWYVGVCDAVVLQDPTDSTLFWTGSRTSTSARSTWVSVSVGDAYAMPILFWYLDDRSSRLHTLHSKGGSFYVCVLNLLTMEREQILIPDEIGIVTVKAFTYKPEDRCYYMVVNANGVDTLSSYNTLREQWDDIKVVNGSNIKGLLKLGVLCWIMRSTGVEEINVIKKTSEATSLSRWVDAGHTATAILGVSQCSSRYAGVLIVASDGSWRIQVCYGPRRAGESFKVPITFRRYIAYNPSTGTRIPRQIGDTTELSDTAWATTGPADDTIVDGDLPDIPADYKSTDTPTVLELIASSESADTHIYYYLPTRRFKGFIRVVFLVWDSGLNKWRFYYSAYSSDIGPFFRQGSPGGFDPDENEYRCFSPLSIARASTDPDILNAPIFMAGRAIKRGSNVNGTQDDPDTAIRSVAVSNLADQNAGDPIFESTQWTLRGDTSPVLSGTDPEVDAFPAGFPVLQIFDNFENDNNTAITKIAGSLQEATTPNLLRTEQTKTVNGTTSLGAATNIAGAAHIASWEAKGQHEMTLEDEQTHPMALYPTGASMDFWQDRCTPAAERFDLITNTRYGRGADLANVSVASHLALHGFSREYVAIVDSVTTITRAPRDDAATLYTGSPIDFQGDYLQFTVLSGNNSAFGVHGLTTGGPVIRFSSDRVEMFGATTLDPAVAVAFPTSNSIGVRIECYYRSHATAVQDFECSRVKVCCRGADDFGDYVYAVLEQVATNQVRLAAFIIRNRVIRLLARSSVILTLPGTTDQDDLLTLQISADSDIISARVTWDTHGWSDVLTITNSELSTNNRVGYMFYADGTTGERRAITRVSYTKFIPAASNVLYSFLGTDSFSGATLQYRLLPGWRSGRWNAGAYTEIGGDAGYQSASNPNLIVIDATAGTVIAPAVQNTILYRQDEVQAIEITYRDISAGADEIHPIFRLSTDKRQWIQVRLKRGINATVFDDDVSFYTNIEVIKYSVNLAGAVSSTTLETHLYSPTASPGQELRTVIFSRAAFVRWELEGDYVVCRVNGMVAFRSVAITDYRSNPYYGIGMQPADGVTANVAAGFRVVSSTANTPEIDPNPITVLERYAHNHIINDQTDLADALEDIDSQCFAYDLERPNEFAVGFESGYSEPIMRFAASMIKPDSFSLGVRASRAGPNRIVVRFFNEDDRREDAEPVDDEIDQSTNGVREVERVLFAVTNRYRAIYIGRQLLEAPQVDRMYITFRTGLYARILEPGDVIAVDHPFGRFTGRPFRIEKVQDTTRDVQITALEVSMFTIDDSLLVARKQTVQPSISRF